MDDEKQKWEEVVSTYQEACLLKQQGRMEASNQVLRHQLPRRIAAWSRANPRPPSEKKAALAELFKCEQRRIEDAWLISQITASQWREELIPMVCETVAREVEIAISRQFAIQEVQNALAASELVRTAPRVAIDNIPGIIDAIQTQQSRTRIQNSRSKPLR